SLVLGCPRFLLISQALLPPDMFCLYPSGKERFWLPDRYRQVKHLQLPDQVCRYDQLFSGEIIDVFSGHNHVTSCLWVSIMVKYRSYYQLHRSSKKKDMVNRCMVKSSILNQAAIIH